ncbi:MAG: RecB family exonuclease [Gemmatimonadota bacterium]
MADLGPFPSFSWSHSRRSTFRECPRMYYWQYYGYWDGWTEEAPEEARRAWRLKQVTNLHMLAGSVIHELASEAILLARGGKVPPTAESLIARGRERLNRAYVESQRRAEWERRPKARTMLHSFYYGTGPSDRLIHTIREKLVTCLANLLQSGSYREALAAPFVEVREVDRPASFRLEGYEVYVQPDLLYRGGDGRYRLVDWKTGARDELHPEQLRAYGLYVRAREDLEDGPIEGCLEYLLTGERECRPLTEADLEEERREILDSIDAMRGYLASPERNEPFPRERFALRPDLERCPACRFYELDEAEIEAAAGERGPF